MLTFLVEALQRLVSFLDRRRSTLLVAVAVLVFAGGVTGVVTWRPPVLVPAITAVETGVQWVISRPGQWVKYFKSPRVDRARLVELELEIARLREAGLENDRLRRMLDYTAPPTHTPVPGHVIGLDLDPLRGMGWIDVGRNRGLQGGEPVFTPEGLVGVVDEPRDRSSRVRLLRNREAPVGVRDTRSRVLGVLEWDPGRGRFEMGFVPRQADVAVGDTLVSSGLGGVFPMGLPVGRIETVTDAPQRMVKDIVVRPFARFHRLEEVFVLLPADSTRAASPDSSGSPGGKSAP